MSRWKHAGAALAIILLFLVANRGAYKGYFQDDDLDNLAWTPGLDATDFLSALVTPVFSRNNFRPVGHFYFHVMERLARLHFAPYVAVLQCIHLLNGLLIWLVLRRLKIHPVAALAGTVFFLYHPATFAGYWQPMYIFDLLCGTFCLLAFLAFSHGRWLLSFVCFLLAYKSKEVAVMLPAVLAAYEFLVGEKKWKPLVPFVLVSLLFGVQALVSNVNTHDAYTLRVTPATLLESARFYAPQLFAFGIAAIAVLVGVILLRDRRAFLGICAALLFLIPLIILPSRLYSVYLYVPIIGAALALAAIFDHTKAWAAMLFLAVWIPYTFVHMREYRRSALTAADENRSYVSGLADFVRSSPQTSTFIEDGAPAAMHPWGISGAIRYLSNKTEIQLAAIDEPESKALLAQPHLAILSWDRVTRKLQVARREPGTPQESYISMQRGMPIWQFGDGWYQRENMYRWTKPVANAVLRLPDDARSFEVVVNIAPVHIRDVSRIKLQVLVDGGSIGEQEFTTSGWQKRSYSLKPHPPGTVSVEFRSSPAYHPQGDPRILGIAIGGFGFRKYYTESAPP